MTYMLWDSMASSRGRFRADHADIELIKGCAFCFLINQSIPQPDEAHAKGALEPINLGWHKVTRMDTCRCATHAHKGTRRSRRAACGLRLIRKASEESTREAEYVASRTFEGESGLAGRSCG